MKKFLAPLLLIVALFAGCADSPADAQPLYIITVQETGDGGNRADSPPGGDADEAPADADEHIDVRDEHIDVRDEPAETPDALGAVRKADLHEVSLPDAPIAPASASLVGSWDWMGSVYYVFDADGRGTMAGMHIRWTQYDGVLSVCVTPDVCGATCRFPTEWDYTLSDNEMTLASRQIDGVAFTYTRQADVAAAPAAPAPASEPASLVGSWDWMGSTYYVFNANGRGTMVGMDIRWTQRGGVLSICSTPDLCGTSCIAPSQWNYTLSGNQLTLSSRQIAGMSFTYTRR